MVVAAEPWRDAEPETDATLIDAHVEDPRAALLAQERTTHLSFMEMEQLLRWAGDQVAPSASVATLGSADRKELYDAVHRFAPVEREERRVAPADECALTYPPSVSATDEALAGYTSFGRGEGGEECAVSDTDICMLERAYLRAGLDKTGDAAAATDLLVEYASSRRELYSFALSRLFSLSAEDAETLLTGTSSSVRLELAERQMAATRKWLGGRLGLSERPRLGEKPRLTHVVADLGASLGAKLPKIPEAALTLTQRWGDKRRRGYRPE